jgi:uncharacterized protein (DUF169 family)
MVCKTNQLYHIDQCNHEFRGVIIAGKAVSVYSIQ